MNSPIRNIFILLISSLFIFAISLFMTGCTADKDRSNPSVNSSVDSSKKAESSLTSSGISEASKSKNSSFSVSICEDDSEDKRISPKSGSRSIPVLMYHSIAYEKNNPVRIPPEKFKEQMKYLKDNGYTALSLDDLYRYFEEEISIPPKSVVITFDDGYEDNYKEAYPVLKEYGFSACIFMITDNIDKKGCLTSSELKELDENNISIESHTVTHNKLNELSYGRQLEELEHSKKTLEKLLNKEVKYAAYPYGSYNKDTVKAAKDAGYIMAFTTDGRWSGKEDGILTLDRVYISGFFNINTFKERITNPDYKMK